MKKTNILIIISSIIVILAAVVYYSYFLPDGQTVVVKLKESEINNPESNNQEQAEKKINVENNTVLNTENNKTQLEAKDLNAEISEKDSIEGENSVEHLADKKTYQSLIKHSYQKEFKNPFEDYRVIDKDIDSDDKKLTIEAIKAMLPFKLKGIIGNDTSRLAVINYNNEARIVKEETVIEEFNIKEILDEELLIIYRGVQFKIKMGSGIGEAL